MKRIKILMMMVLLGTTTLCAQGVKPLPSLHVEGKWLVDKHGNQVVLHGVMDTPSSYFNGGRWHGVKTGQWKDSNGNWHDVWDDYNDTGAANCLAYFDKIFNGLEQAKCNVFRLHMDPAWTNDPNKQSDGKESGEADISRFSESRYNYYLSKVYLELAKKAMDHGMFVVVRPPGVCPGSLKVGDYYQDYLKKVWNIFSKSEYVQQHAGQISIELANEPVSLKNASNQDDPKALHDYFQPIVDLIRGNGFTGIIWVPGTGWQQNYRDYAQYPITGDNIGYAVHDYCGWYGSSDDNPDPQNKIQQFHDAVPVVDFAPVIITEVDWSPVNPNGQGHYDEHGNWVQPNYGTWATGSTSKWGKAYKANIDHFQNISMTLSGTGCLIDEDALINANFVMPAFSGLEEACGKACMDWYVEYYKVNWPHADDEAETGDFYTLEKIEIVGGDMELDASDNILLSLKACYADGHTQEICDQATYVIANPDIVSISATGYIKALAEGSSQVTVTYTDKRGQQQQTTFNVKVKGIGDMTALTSMEKIEELPFAIVSVDDNKMFYCPNDQNLGFDPVKQVTANSSIKGYKFQASLLAGTNNQYLLRLITLTGSEYEVFGKPGYLNSQPVDGGWCSFILGLTKGNGEDVKDGALWEIKYVDGQGFTMRNMATGLYLKDAGPAKYSTPTYYNFLVDSDAAGIQNIKADSNISTRDAVYNLQGVRVGTASQLSTLPRGIYLVGGRKVVKR